MRLGVKVEDMSEKDDAAAAYYRDPANRMSDGPGNGLPGRPERLSDHVPIRLDRATVTAIKRFSDEDGMTVSSWVRHVVKQEVERRTNLTSRTGFARGFTPAITLDPIGQSQPGTMPTASLHGLRVAS
jgi:hypothetical protein